MNNWYNNVMVIDYDEEIVKIVTRMLELEGYDVTVTDDGSAALALMEENRPDSGILDIIKLDMDAYAVCQCIRENSEIPIILVTARGSDEEEAEELDNSADHHIAKPLSTKELSSRIREMLRGAMHGDDYPQPESHCHALIIDLASHKVR